VFLSTEKNKKIFIEEKLMKNGDAMTKFPEFWPAYLVCAHAHMVEHRATKYDRITQHREGKFYMVDGDMAYYVSPQLICTV